MSGLKALPQPETSAMLLWERLQPRPKGLSGLKALPQRRSPLSLWERLQPRPHRGSRDQWSGPQSRSSISPLTLTAMRAVPASMGTGATRFIMGAASIIAMRTGTGLPPFSLTDRRTRR